MKTGLYFQDPKYAVGDVRPDFIFDPSLVLYLPLYKLDGASFMSKDAYGHLCTVTGALWTPRGRDFDGTDDYILVPHTDSIAITDILTILAWVKTSRTAHMIIVGKDYREYEIGLVQTSTRIQVYYGDGTSNQPVALDNTPDIWDDNFHHIGVVIRKDGAGCDSIIDGNFIESVTSGALTGSGTRNVYIGLRSSDQSINFLGTIGEVMIYNRALTPLEIQRNYLATKWRYR